MTVSRAACQFPWKDRLAALFQRVDGDTSVEVRTADKETVRQNRPISMRFVGRFGIWEHDAETKLFEYHYVDLGR